MSLAVMVPALEIIEKALDEEARKNKKKGNIKI